MATSRSNGRLPKFQRVMVVSAHPDDPDFGAGGSIARLADSGAEVTYVIVTDGRQGGEDPKQKDAELVAIREKEQRAAASSPGRELPSAMAPESTLDSASSSCHGRASAAHWAAPSLPTAVT